MHLLLLSKASVDVVDAAGLTPLHVACLYRSARCVRVLLRFGADLKKRGLFDLTPLHYVLSALPYDLAIVECLLEHGVDMDATDNHLRSPLDLAVSHGQADAVNLLVARGANVQAPALRRMVLDGDLLPTLLKGNSVDGALKPTRLLQLMLRRMPPHREQPQPGTLNAREWCHLVVDAPPGESCLSGLVLGLPSHRGCHIVVVHALALRSFGLDGYEPHDGDRDPFVEQDVDRPLLAALREQRLLECFQRARRNLRLLITKPARMTPLGVAAAAGCLPLMKLLIFLGANTNLPDLDGQTPLHRAAQAESPEGFGYLARHGARTEAVDLDGRTPAALFMQRFVDRLSPLQAEAVTSCLPEELR